MRRAAFLMILAAALSRSAPAHAQSGFTPVGISTMACHEVAVTSATVVSIVNNVASLSWPPATAVIQIQNQDAAASIYCSQDASVSSFTAAHLGWQISGGASWTVSIPASSQFYCVGQSTSPESSMQTISCKQE